MSESKGLRNGHLAFVNEYFLCNMNATDAYAKTHPKATRESARRLASQLLTNIDVQEEIQRRLKEKQLSADEVLARLGDMARGDIADFVGIESPSDMLNEEYRGKTHVIKKVKRNVTITRTKDGGEIEHQYTELEMYSALDALEKAGRHHAIFTDKIEHSGDENKPVIVKVIKGISTNDL